MDRQREVGRRAMKVRRGSPPDGDNPPARERQHESGQGLAEYALILAFVALAAVVALSALGQAILNSPGWSLP